MYKLTKDGLRYAREMVSVAREQPTGEPAFDGVVGL
jgi:hypothetical protein